MTRGARGRLCACGGQGRSAGGAVFAPASAMDMILVSRNGAALRASHFLFEPQIPDGGLDADTR